MIDYVAMKLSIVPRIKRLSFETDRLAVSKLLWIVGVGRLGWVDVG